MFISVRDMFSIGIGPSSSHTVGPMRAANHFIQSMHDKGHIIRTARLVVDLLGSLSLTGEGHGTVDAVALGLAGHQPETIDPTRVPSYLEHVRASGGLTLAQNLVLPFDIDHDVRLLGGHSELLHPNTMILKALDQADNCIYEETWLSVGGGVIVPVVDGAPVHQVKIDMPVPYPFDTAEQLGELCESTGQSISALVQANEYAVHDKDEIDAYMDSIWTVMEACIEQGCRTEGILPGGLEVIRRAPRMFRKLRALEKFHGDPLQAMDWVDLFALAVNEENAAGGRVVTAPTNGASGVIPAVMAYYHRFIREMDAETVRHFLLTATAIGSLYQKNASISGAEVGCQGEVGVACSMAAGALTEIQGGTWQQVHNAAEIGMEHNLGLTCDPVGGLVQIPCIERNAMGAVKAINASRIALRGSGLHRISLDKVIRTMWETGQDMQSKYKETAEGGLAVNVVEC